MYNEFKRHCFIIFYFVLVLLIKSTRTTHQNLTGVWCWHENRTDSYSSQPFSECPGVNLIWVSEPSERVVATVPLNVSVQLSLNRTFWDWAIAPCSVGRKPNFFHVISSETGLSTASSLKTWCESGSLGCGPALVNSSSCCLSDIRLMTCQQQSGQPFCGPWNASFENNGYSANFSNPTTYTLFFNNGIVEPVPQWLYVRFKLDSLFITIGYSINVVPFPVCGDGFCQEPEEGCRTCSADCGSCYGSSTSVALILVTIIVAIALGFIIVFLISNYKKRRILFDESWIIPSHHFIKGSCVQENDTIEAVSSEIDLHYSDEQQFDKKVDSIVLNVHTDVCKYNGTYVAIKRIPKQDFLLQNESRAEVAQIRSLHCKHLAHFIGASISPTEVIIVTEYCTKGSLRDILLNTTEPLMWRFRLSFVENIVDGMNYLHKNIVLHGRLRSTNCHIDGIWRLRVADYGLYNLRVPYVEDTDDFIVTRESLVKKAIESIYTAPELRQRNNGTDDNNKRKLGGKSSNKHGYSCEADVYAFGVILVEIANRTGPNVHTNPLELPPNFKPPLPNHEVRTNEDKCPCILEYNNLIEHCWTEGPLWRWTFNRIKQHINVMFPKKLYGVENSILLMKTNSDYLEKRVTKLEKELNQEKEKFDKFVYSTGDIAMERAANKLLPTPSPAENFDCITACVIQLSDFNLLIPSLTAIQTVKLLNEVHRTLEQVIRTFQVYTFNCSSDTYNVVSGVPIRNEEQHAPEIANMALSIMHAARDIFHCTKDSVQKHRAKLRIAINSGPVGAGLVNSRYLKYAIFGDTLHVASLLATKCEANRILCSPMTHRLLLKLGGFLFEPYGTAYVKEKGHMAVWWLLGTSGQ